MGESRPVSMLAAGLVALALAGGVAWSAPRASLPPGVVLSFDTAQTDYRRGEAVVFRLTIRNGGPHSVRLTFDSGQYAIAVWRNGGTIWTISRSVPSQQLPQRLILERGQAITFVESWNQATAQGAPAGAGRYRADAVFRGSIETMPVGVESRQAGAPSVGMAGSRPPRGVGVGRSAQSTVGIALQSLAFTIRD